VFEELYLTQILSLRRSGLILFLLFVINSVTRKLADYYSLPSMLHGTLVSESTWSTHLTSIRFTPMLKAPIPATLTLNYALTASSAGTQ
jgi:hypothetical protein